MDERKNSIGEEARAVGERVSGAAKDIAGAMTGNERLESEGERERAEGRARQTANDATSALNSGYITGLYRTPEEAATAYDHLTTKHGYKRDDVDVMMSDDTRRRYYPDTKHGQELSSGTKAAEGLGVGSAIGAV